MSEEQLSALLAKLKEDELLKERLKDAADLGEAVAIAKDAGFDVSKADWLKHQAKQTLELSDEELEGVAGGKEVRSSLIISCGQATCGCP
jgi:predicted ribosomally synthesized peptide with nif11-like leader